MFGFEHSNDLVTCIDNMVYLLIKSRLFEYPILSGIFHELFGISLLKVFSCFPDYTTVFLTNKVSQLLMVSFQREVTLIVVMN